MIGALLMALQVAATDPAVVSRTVPDTNLGVTFRAIAFPDTVVVGQQARYQVAVFVTEEVRERLRRNPEFVPPELRAMLAYDLPGGYSVLHNRRIGGRTYEIHIFERAIFPLTAGTHTIPPAELTYALPLGSSFFSREESHTLRSEVVTLVCVEPPSAGRPPGWMGAAGVFVVSTHLDAHEVRAGEPVTLTMRVEGDGNINLLPRPPVAIDWGTAVAAGERVTIDSANQTVRGAKEFDWLVTPRAEGDVVLQGVRYPFYDPVSRTWQDPVGAAETLHVAPGIVATARARSTTRDAVPPLRRRWRGPLPLPIATQLPFWLAVLLVPLPAAVIGVRRLLRWSRSMRRGRSAAERLRDPALSVDEARRAFRRALDERLGLGMESVAQTPDVAHLLRRAGVTSGTALSTATLLAELDAAAFANAIPPHDASTRLRQLMRAIDREAVRTAARVLLLTTFGIGVLASAIGSAPADEAARAFADGLRAQQRGEVALAREHFARAAVWSARAPDAWANLGATELAMQDTAAAAQAWQRALRLEPDATDVRAALAVFAAPSDGWIAWVPPVHTDVAALLALALWSAGWVGVAHGADRGSRRRTVVAVAVAVMGVAVGFTALDARRRSVAASLAVVRGGEPLRALPALAGDPTAQLLSGEIARIDSLTGPWARVSLDGERAGWIARERLLDLALPSR